MNSKSIFSYLPDEMHNIDYNIHNNIKSLLNELLLNFTCENCDCIKNSYLYKDKFCSMICMQASNDYYYEDYREIQTDYEEKMYYKQEYKDYIKYKKN
jgi:hypothetical protein